MEISAYLNFNGNCAQPFAFYAKVLGGKIERMDKFGTSPLKDQMPPSMQDAVLHVRLAVGNQALLGLDAAPHRLVKAAGMSVTLNVKGFNEGKRLFDALAEGGTATMPFSKPFWSEGFGALTDRFGTPWMINAE